MEALPVIDTIDIGTNRFPLRSSGHLVTFDPFDPPLKRPGYERLGFAITAAADGGTSTFYINNDFDPCSSLLPVNPAFRLPKDGGDRDAYSADCLPERGCELWNRTTWCAVDKHNVIRRVPKADCQVCSANDGWGHFHRMCRRPRKGWRNITVPTVRLSTFLNERSVSTVNFLKIDAQGADRAIVRDVLMRTKVSIHHLRAECQFLDRTLPLYVDDGSGAYPPNDCLAIVKLVHRLRPNLDQESWELSNCHVAEYNVDLWDSSTRGKGHASQRRL